MSVTIKQLRCIAERLVAANDQTTFRHAAAVTEALLKACGEEGVEITGEIATKASDFQVAGDHYKSDPIQHFEFCQRNRIPWCESAAIKYLVRHKKKNGVQDLDKAMHYILLARQVEYPAAAPFKLG